MSAVQNKHITLAENTYVPHLFGAVEWMMKFIYIYRQYNKRMYIKFIFREKMDNNKNEMSITVIRLLAI